MSVGKFLDLNLADLEFDQSSALNVAGGTIAGRKEFLVHPVLADSVDLFSVPSDAALPGKAYLDSEAGKIVGAGVVYHHEITATNVTEKKIVWPGTANLHGSVIASVEGAPELAPGMDYEILPDGDGISWDGYALDGRIREGDLIRVVYKGVSE